MANKQLTRSPTDRWIAGVCGGIAEYTHLPSILIRIITIILLFVPIPIILVVIIYTLLWMTLPVGRPRKQIDQNAIDVEFEVRE